MVPPSDDELKKQTGRLTRAQSVSSAVWSATKWSALPILGTLAATLGLSFAVSGGNWWAIGLVIASAIVGVIGGGAAILANVTIRSRQRVLDTKTLPKSGLRFLVIVIALQFICCVIALSTQASALGVALAVAAKPSATLDARLRDRMVDFDGAKDEADAGRIAETRIRIEAFCAEHSDDDKATNLFKEVCAAFNAGATPDSKARQDFEKRLKGPDASRP